MTESKYSTKGGVATSGEAFSKLLWHLDEAADQMAVLMHLERANANNNKSRALADGWFAMSEMFKLIRGRIVMLAKGKLS